MLFSTSLKLFLLTMTLHTANGSPAARVDSGLKIITSPDGVKYSLPASSYERKFNNGTQIVKTTTYTYPDVSDNPSQAVKRMLIKRQNKCGNSSFRNKASGGSPYIWDCRNLVRDLEADGGVWKIFPSSGGEFRGIKSSFTCIIGARVKESGGVYIGSNDLIDLLNDVINRFVWQAQRVAGEGDMPCQSVYYRTTYNANWAVWHT